MSIVDRIKETVQGWFGGSADKAASEAQGQASTMQETAGEAQAAAGAAVEEAAEAATDEEAGDAESEEDTESDSGDAATAQTDEAAGSAAEMSASASAEAAAVVEETVDIAEEPVAGAAEVATEAAADVEDAAEAVAAVTTADGPVIEPPDDEPITQVEVEADFLASSGVGDKIEDIEGIGPAYGDKLAGVGIMTTGDLLDRCGDRQGRETVAEATGLAAGQLLKWANMADLMRVKGVGGEFAELLEAAGVDTVNELGQRNAENLANVMQVTNEERNLTRRTPSASQIQDWIKQANELEPMISH